MMKLLKNVRLSKSGASAAEYALILAVVGGGIVVAAGVLKTAIGGAMTTTAGVINPAA